MCEPLMLDGGYLHHVTQYVTPAAEANRTFLRSNRGRLASAQRGRVSRPGVALTDGGRACGLAQSVNYAQPPAAVTISRMTARWSDPH